MMPLLITCSYRAVQQQGEMKSSSSSSSDSNGEFYRTLWGSKRLDRETAVVLLARMLAAILSRISAITVLLWKASDSSS